MNNEKISLALTLNEGETEVNFFSPGLSSELERRVIEQLSLHVNTPSIRRVKLLESMSGIDMLAFTVFYNRAESRALGIDTTEVVYLSPDQLNTEVIDVEAEVEDDFNFVLDEGSFYSSANDLLDYENYTFSLRGVIL